MSFAKILVPVTGADRDTAVLAGGFAAAKLFGARVEALFVRPDPVEAMPFYGEGMSSGVVQEIMDVSKDAASKAAKVARAHLEAAAKANDASVGAPAKGLTAAFREIEGNFQTQVTLAARLADLVVFGPVRENDRPGLGEAFDATLLETGRPVLLNAGHTSGDLVSRIAVAWNGSVASAHAVSAALPFLKKAKAVDVLTVGRPSEADPSDDLLEYLSLHGVAAAVRNVDGGNRPVADVLLEAATSGGAGLLVAGGYGHNRLRELFVTGTTKRVVAQTTLPCFLVH